MGWESVGRSESGREPVRTFARIPTHAMRLREWAFRPPAVILAVPRDGLQAAVVLVAAVVGCGAVPSAASVVDAVAPSAVFSHRSHSAVQVADVVPPAFAEAAGVPGSALQSAWFAVADTFDRVWCFRCSVVEVPGGVAARLHAQHWRDEMQPWDDWPRGDRVLLPREQQRHPVR